MPCPVNRLAMDNRVTKKILHPVAEQSKGDHSLQPHTHLTLMSKLGSEDASLVGSTDPAVEVRLRDQ